MYSRAPEVCLLRREDAFVLEALATEVQQKADRVPGGAQVGDHLGHFVVRQRMRYRLFLDDYFLLDQVIKVEEANRDAVQSDVDWMLRLE
jgi:hypothetical protein